MVTILRVDFALVKLLLIDLELLRRTIGRKGNASVNVVSEEDIEYLNTQYMRYSELQI